MGLKQGLIKCLVRSILNFPPLLQLLNQHFSKLRCQMSSPKGKMILRNKFCQLPQASYLHRSQHREGFNNIAKTRKMKLLKCIQKITHKHLVSGSDLFNQSFTDQGLIAAASLRLSRVTTVISNGVKEKPFHWQQLNQFQYDASMELKKNSNGLEVIMVDMNSKPLLTGNLSMDSNLPKKRLEQLRTMLQITSTGADSMLKVSLHYTVLDTQTQQPESSLISQTGLYKYASLALLKHD